METMEGPPFEYESASTEDWKQYQILDEFHKYRANMLDFMKYNASFVKTIMKRLSQIDNDEAGQLHEEIKDMEFWKEYFSDSTDSN